MFTNEGGKAITGASQIPKEMYDETVQGVLKKTGLNKLKLGTDVKPVGNTSKPFLGDIDLSINYQVLKDYWKLPEINDDEDSEKTPKNDFWEALKVKLQEIDPNATVNRGLKQFHVPAAILKNGVQQPEFHDGQPVEGTKAIVQVDFFVGNVEWMTDMLSGSPQESNFKAVFRNTLLGNIISKAYSKEYSSEKDDGYQKEKEFLLSKGKRVPDFSAGEKMVVGYVLDFKNGLEKKYTLIIPPSGRQRTPQEKRSYRFVERNKIDQMAEFIFGQGTKWSDLNSFEKVFAKFDSDPYFNKIHGDKKNLIEDETIEGLDSNQRVMFLAQSNLKKFDEYRRIAAKMSGRLKKDLETAQLQLQKIQSKDSSKLSANEQEKLETIPEKIQIIQKALQEYGSVSESLNEAREGIGRFAGDSQFTNKDFLEVLKKLAEETDNVGKSEFTINFLENKSVDMVEKMDASFMQFGLDPKGKFFMEPNYGGPVTIENVKAKFGFKKDSFDSFMALYENKKFQEALQQIFKFYGPFKFDAEMFPTFTHEGTKDGDVVFASTRYKKDKFGKFGGFVVFKTWLFEKSNYDWKRPEPALNSAIIAKFKDLSSSFMDEWKIYSNDADMRLPGSIKVDVGNLAEYLADETKYQELLAALSTTKKSELRTRFLPVINSLRVQLQEALDNYANNTSSKLGDSKSKVEGVVLRIKAKDGDVFEVKGTSEDFAKQAKIVWQDRMKIKDIESAFYENVLKNALNAQVYNQETKTWDTEVTSAKLTKVVNNISSKLNPKEETIQSYLEALLPFITPTPQESVKELNTKLKVEIFKAREELKAVEEGLKDRQQVLDIDSFRKTKDFINSLKIILNDYEIILTGKGTNEQKYVAILEKFFGKKMEHAIVAKKPQDSSEEFAKRTKVILWSGRAQPWHKGHHNMVELAKGKLEELGADKVFIVIIRGADSSTNVEENPLQKEEQEKLINLVYANDPKVELSEVFPPSPAPQILVNKLIYEKGYIVVGWLAGDDRIDSYQKFIDGYVPQAFKSNHEYAPIDFNPKTGKKAELIKTPRVMSGTESRELTLKLPFEQWFAKVAPAGVSSSAKKEYEKVYNIIKERLQSASGIKKVQEIVISSLNETIKKRGNKYCLLSKKTKRNLGCYNSRTGAEKRERQVQYFKHMKEESTAAGIQGFSGPLKDKEEN